MTIPKKQGRRDSNWYVSITTFWKEFKRHKLGIGGVIILGLFCVMAIAAPILATHDPSPLNKVAPSFLAPDWMSVFDPEGVVTEQVVPDPYFTTPSNYTIRGSNPEQFSYSYYDAPVDSDSYSSLTWTHRAGDNLTWTEDPEGQLPAAENIIFLHQTFHWSWERMPSDVNVSLSFAIEKTGTFADDEYGGIMFKVFIWLIDSSGNWQRVYESHPPHFNTFITRSSDLSYYELAAGWGGMVEGPDGHQDDPTDELTVAVGITPSANFKSFLGTNPWMNYTGSVTVKMNELRVVAYGDYFGLLGTTDKGADAWSQLVYGSRISLTIGIIATALTTVVGVIVGMVAGYFGGKTDEVLMRIVDFLLVIPGLPLMMVLAAFLGPTIENIIVVIAILGWTGTSRLIRSQVMAEKNKAYVESARAIGASDTYIIFRHILPNVTPILFADITLGVVGAILAESGLAFLGLTDPSEPSWGRMLADAQNSGGFSAGAWWVVVFPGMMITIISLAFTFVGHTLDQVLNPRLRER